MVENQEKQVGQHDMHDQNIQNQEYQEHDDHDGHDGENETKDAKKHKKRTHQKRPLTEADTRLQETKGYLADHGIHYQIFLQHHYSRAVSKKAAGCCKFTELQQTLMNGKEPECAHCQALLKSCSVSIVGLQDFLDQEVPQRMHRAKNARSSKEKPKRFKTSDCAGHDKTDLGIIDVSVDDSEDQNEDDEIEILGTVGLDVIEHASKPFKIEHSEPTKPELSDSKEKIEKIGDGKEPAKSKNHKVKKKAPKHLEEDATAPRGLEAVRAMGNVFTILPKHLYRQKIPVRCNVCKPIARKGAAPIFDLVTAYSRTFLDSHLRSSRHRMSVQHSRESRQHEPDQEHIPTSNGQDEKNMPIMPADPVECGGFTFEEFPHCRLSLVREEFDLYATYTNLRCADAARAARCHADDVGDAPDETGVGHRYVHDIASSTWKIFHRRCKKVVKCKPTDQYGENGLTCEACRSISVDKTLIRNVARNTLKIFAAKLLRAKLFLTEDPGTLEANMRQSELIQCCQSAKREFEGILIFTTPELQRWVRASFKCMPPSKLNPNLAYFIASVVDPCVIVSPHGAVNDKAGRAETLARYLTQGKLSEVQDVDIRLACCVASGMLEAHPLMHGMLVAVCEKIRRENRGVFSMKGLKLSEEEQTLIADAGVSLSVATANKSLLKMFGMAHTKVKNDLCSLSQSGIPDPFLAVCDVSVLKQNGCAAESCFPMLEGGSFRRLCLAFDKTYVLKQVNVLKNRLGKGLVGIAWKPQVDQQVSNKNIIGDVGDAFLDLGLDGEDDTEGPSKSSPLKSVDFGTANYAREMLDCIVWDPATKTKENPRFSICSVPMSDDCSAEAMLVTLGQILLNAGSAVRSVSFDNHSSHQLIKHALLGLYVAKPNIPFFGELEYHPLPSSCIRNLGYQIPVFQGQSILCQNGPCHIQKNVVSAMRSHCRTLYVGKFWLDPSATRDLGMMPGAFCGFDRQSDAQAAMFLNPYHLLALPSNPSSLGLFKEEFY